LGEKILVLGLGSRCSPIAGSVCIVIVALKLKQALRSR
jgi:hypothetical protein